MLRSFTFEIMGVIEKETHLSDEMKQHKAYLSNLSFESKTRRVINSKSQETSEQHFENRLYQYVHLQNQDSQGALKSGDDRNRKGTRPLKARQSKSHSATFKDKDSDSKIGSKPYRAKKEATGDKKVTKKSN